MNVCHNINTAKARHDRDAAAWLAQVERERAARAHAPAIVRSRAGTASRGQHMRSAAD